MSHPVTETISERFSGTARLYGKSGLAALCQSHVMVVGVGGVGSWAVEALARTAVGKISLVDLDDICITNSNRQIQALTNNVGKLKVDVLAERVTQINPECEVVCHRDFISADNQAALLSDRPDYVIDAIDSVPAKVALIAYCKRNKIRIITVGGAGGQKDPSKVEIRDLSRTWNDPLAAKVRSELRYRHGFTKNPKRRFSVECVFSTEQLTYPAADGEVCQQKTLTDGSVKLDCAIGLGAGVCVTATFGFVAASRVVEKLISLQA